MPVLIHSARRGQNPAVIFPSALLVEGSAPKPLWTQNFILRLRVLRTLFYLHAPTTGHGDKNQTSLHNLYSKAMPSHKKFMA